MSENFIPIPSLNNLYEINPQGVVRNAKTKKELSVMVGFQFKGKHTSRTVASLLFEVHGQKSQLQKMQAIQCSCSDGDKKYHFQTLKELAKFLAPKTRYKRKTVEDYLSKRKSEIGIWQIKYFDEPQPKAKNIGGKIEMKIPASVEETGATVLVGKYFLEIISKLTGDAVTISTGENLAEITSEGTKYNLLIMDSEDLQKFYKKKIENVISIKYFSSNLITLKYPQIGGCDREIF